MITKQEIMDCAREFSLSPETVEKDYVLGWLLAGIAAHPQLFDQWIFKGGTCLKKCYFETYRFSEDLDYTLLNERHLNETFLVDAFKHIASWIYDASGIALPTDRIRFEIYQNSAGKTSAEGRIYYTGPLERRGNPTRIKLDLTADELLVLPPALRAVHHPYSDKPKNGMDAHCYHFLEVFAEKIRALSERARPRDLYDVIHLYRHATPTLQPKQLLEVLQKKCAYKKLPTPTFQLLDQHPKLKELEREWSNMLAHQLPMLPENTSFWQELPQVFNWLYSDHNKIQKEPAPPSQDLCIDLSWEPPSMIQAWSMKTPIELIRYAGANHLCLEIEYEHKSFLVEPYRFVKTKQGEIILLAILADTAQPVHFHLNCIEKITVTPLSFFPKYAVSLTPFIALVI